MLLAAQGARTVHLDATLAGKPYGKVTYVRGQVAGRGVERTVTLDVNDDTGKYQISEKRTYSSTGAPVSVLRTLTEGDQKITVTLVYNGLEARVTYDHAGSQETETFKLEKENATTTDPSQLWFFGSAPAVGTKCAFWEYSLDANAWVERTVSYPGMAELKLGDKTIKAHRIAVGKDTNFYVDEWGMPYKSSQDTAAGNLTLVRTS